MATAYILAKTLKEAHDFAAKDLALPRGTYRPVTSPSTLTSIRNADLYLLPGWDSRHDRFAMRGALKWTKMNVIDAAKWRAEREAAAENPYVPLGKPNLPPEEHQIAPGGGLVVGTTPTDEPTFHRAQGGTSVEDAQAFFEGVNDAPAAPVAEPEAPKPEKAPELDPAIYGPPIDRSAFPMSPDMVITNPPESEKKKRIRRKRCPKCNELILPTEFDEHVTNCEPEEA